MKKTMTILAFMMLLTPAIAQHFELKLFTSGASRGMYSLNGEYLIDNHFGIEVIPSYISYKGRTYGTVDLYKTNGAAIQAGIKYYFSPKRGCDRLSFGLHVERSTSRSKLVSFPKSTSIVPDERGVQLFIPGVSLCYKWVLKPRITIELGFSFLYRYSYASYQVNNNVKVPNNFRSGSSIITNRIAIGYRFGGRDVE